MELAAQSRRQHGISVITCTNRPTYIRNLFRNYLRQRHTKKELIIIVNHQNMSMSRYQQWANKLGNVRIYRLPRTYTLGACLNYAVRKSVHPYIAKFDDDDYYSPYYLTECLQSFRRSKADIIGKRAHYMYLQGSKALLLRFPNDQHKYVSKLPGATLVFRRKVFGKVQFPNQNVGEDDIFCLRGKKQGYRIYSAGKYNFLAIRRRNSYQHTWIISDQKLLAYHKRIPNVRDVRSYVRRKPGGGR